MFLCFYGNVLVTSFTVTLRPLDYGTATRGNPGLTAITQRNAVLSNNRKNISAQFLKRKRSTVCVCMRMRPLTQTGCDPRNRCHKNTTANPVTCIISRPWAKLPSRRHSTHVSKDNNRKHRFFVYLILIYELHSYYPG
jgi:hypothetical protein